MQTVVVVAVGCAPSSLLSALDDVAPTAASRRVRRYDVDVHDVGSGAVLATVTVVPFTTSLSITCLRDASSATQSIVYGIACAAEGGDATVTPQAPPMCVAAVHTTMVGTMQPQQRIFYPLGVVQVRVDGTTGKFEVPLLVTPHLATPGQPHTTPIYRAVALGSDCTVAQALRLASLSGPSLPLDWVRSNPWGLQRFMRVVLGNEPEQLDAFTFAAQLDHTPGTNMYHRSSTSQRGQLLLNSTFGLIATREEAEKLQRRLVRLAELFCDKSAENDGNTTAQRHDTLLLVHAGQTQPAAHVYSVVDEVLLGGGALEADASDRLGAWQQLYATAHVLHQRKVRTSPTDVAAPHVAILLCVNLFPETFTLWCADDMYAHHKCGGGILLAHCAIGCGESWTNTSSSVAKLLGELFCLDNTVGNMHR